MTVSQECLSEIKLITTYTIPHNLLKILYYSFRTLFFTFKLLSSSLEEKSLKPIDTTESLS